MITEYNRSQRRSRLLREITWFEAQCVKFLDQADPQRKRCYTIATRCLKRRRDDLAKLDSRA